jgi:osmotically-inducible protein OsmY
MRKSDAQLQRDVMEELVWDPSVGRAEIGVACKDGVITLGGQVDSYAKKDSAILAAERVSGVKAIADDLVVKIPASIRRTDTDVAHSVTNALQWDIQVPDDKIKARVDAGWVWLDGEVEWEYQRAAAERAVRYLAGVTGLSNNIRIRKTASVPDVKRHIVSALHRNANIDAANIGVEVADGKVTLRGKVHSWSARGDAERAVWSAPGVVAVQDELSVST